MPSIKCGNCKGTHDSVVNVRACYAGTGNHDEAPSLNAHITEKLNTQSPAFALVARGSSRYGMASPKQVDFIESLLKKRDIDGTRFAVPGFDPRQLHSNEASYAIEDLKVLPFKTKANSTIVDLEDGFYRLGETIFKVYHTVHGANQQVAKELVLLPESEWYTKVVRGKEVLVKSELEYRGKAPLHALRPEHKLTLEEALQYGPVYGRCMNCGAPLTANLSIERAMGPVCYSRLAG
jgi:hypothetical protein